MVRSTILPSLLKIFCCFRERRRHLFLDNREMQGGGGKEIFDSFTSTQFKFCCQALTWHCNSKRDICFVIQENQPLWQKDVNNRSCSHVEGTTLPTASINTSLKESPSNWTYYISRYIVVYYR